MSPAPDLWPELPPGALASSRRQRGELASAFAAVRARVGLVAVLLAAAAIAWWSMAGRMAGMDRGPGTALGTLGWFSGVWLLMTAAMMFPSLSPTVALYASMTRRREPSRPLLFTGGYLLVWAGAGLTAYGVFDLGRGSFGSELAWSAGGRWFAAGVLAVSALYELTPLKHVCLAKCQSPVGFLLGHWRDGRLGAVQMGARHAGWCVGCCWALMASLFALGVMSLRWMALVAALIALEKLLPWRRGVTMVTAAVLLALAIMFVAAPDRLPGLTLPTSPHTATDDMNGMG